MWDVRSASAKVSNDLITSYFTISEGIFYYELITDRVIKFYQIELYIINEWCILNFVKFFTAKYSYCNVTVRSKKLKLYANKLLL